MNKSGILLLKELSKIKKIKVPWKKSWYLLIFICINLNIFYVNNSIGRFEIINSPVKLINFLHLKNIKY